MKFIKKQSKIVAVIATVLMLFQSCTVYRNAPATLDEAVASERKVKIHLTSGERIKYKKVLKKEGLYYGVHKKDTLQINLSKIDRVRLKNKSLSTIGTIVLSGVGALALLGGILFLGLAVN